MSKTLSHIEDDEQFFSDVRERITSIIEKRIHSEDAEELVQDAMVEIRSRVGELPNESDLLRVVFEVVRKTIREYYQQKKREKVMKFSTDALYYYQPEMNEEDWKSVLTKAMQQLKEEQPRCAEVLQMTLQVSTMEELSTKLEMQRFNADQMLLRCRTALLKVITENLKNSTAIKHHDARESSSNSSVAAFL